MIQRRLVEEMVAHAREGAPEEVCGLLAGAGGRATDLYRITNIEHSERLYRMDPQEQLAAILDIEDRRGLDVIGVYHSHPATEPRPSVTDIRLAGWPGIEYLIVSLRDPGSPELRSWRIDADSVEEADLRIDG